MNEEFPLVASKKRYYHFDIKKNGLFCLFDMRSKSMRILFAIAISSLIAVFPAYSRYADLSDLSPSSDSLAFESPDQDDQINDQQHESGTPLLSDFSATLPQNTSVFSSSSPFLPTESPDNQKTSVLRC